MSEKQYVSCKYVDYFERHSLTVDKVYELECIDEDGDFHIIEDDLGDSYFLSADQGTLVDAEGNPL